MDRIKKEHSIFIKGGYPNQGGRDCVIDSRETAIKAAIYLMFEWDITIQDFVDEYNKRVRIVELEKLDKEAKDARHS